MSTKTKKTAGTQAAAATKKSGPKAKARTSKVATEATETAVEISQETTDATPAKTNRGGKKKADAAAVAADAAESQTTESPNAKKTRAAKAKTESNGKLSQLDAAIKVLGESTEPMTTKQMAEQMAAKGYWSSPGGKTPHATLYSAILRELQTKGDESRFVKTDRGHFRLRTA